MVAVIGAGAIVTYKHFANSPPASKLPENVSLLQDKNKEQNNFGEQQVAGLTNNVVSIDSEKNRSQSNTDTETISTSANMKVSETLADSNQAKGKTGILGIVIDNSTFKPIKGAEIIYGIYNDRHSTFSDANGRFEAFDMRPSPRQQFYVIAENYATRTIVLEIIENKVYLDFKVELGRGSKVAGTVTDPNGEPVEGATVKTFHFTNKPVITGKDGKFEIDGLDPAFGQYGLQAAHPDYPQANIEFSPLPARQTASVNFVLKPGITVSGQVTNAAGEPIAGVTVGNTTSPLMWNCIKGTTDKDGNYNLKNVPSGELVLWAVTNKYAPYVEKFSLDNSESTRTINIQMSAPYPLHGRIVDSGGNPVAGVNVIISEYKGVVNLARPDERVTSDSEGKFTIPNAPPQGNVILQVYAASIGNVMPEIEIGQQQENIITVERSGRVYGKVVNDKTSEPVGKFNVKMGITTKGTARGGFAASWSRQGHSFDSPQGFFDTGVDTLHVGAQYAITVMSDGFDPLTIDPVIVQQITDEPNRTEFRLKTATMLAGRVIDVNGVSIAGATVRWLTEENKLDTFEHWNPSDIVVTDSKGQFMLSGVSYDKGGIYVTAKNFPSYLCGISELPRNSENSVEIKLSAGAKLYGKVTGLKGEGLVGAEVCVFTFAEQMRKIFSSPWPDVANTITVTDTNGNYEISNLPDGSFQIRVMTTSGMENQAFAFKNISLKSGESIELNFGDELGFTVSGTVKMGQKPLEMASVQIFFTDRFMKRGQTDSKGNFAIKGVPKGTYSIYTSYNSALDPNLRSSQEIYNNRQVDVDADIILDIEFYDSSVSGQIPEQFLKYEQLTRLTFIIIKMDITNMK